MKTMLAQQPIPHVIYLPQEEVMHRFGYEIAIRKLTRTFGNLDTLYFKVCPKSNLLFHKNIQKNI